MLKLKNNPWRLCTVCWQRPAGLGGKPCVAPPHPWVVLWDVLHVLPLYTPGTWLSRRTGSKIPSPEKVHSSRFRHSSSTISSKHIFLCLKLMLLTKLADYSSTWNKDTNNILLNSCLLFLQISYQMHFILSGIIRTAIWKIQQWTPMLALTPSLYCGIVSFGVSLLLHENKTKQNKIRAFWSPH